MELITKTLSERYDGQKKKDDNYYVYMLCDKSEGHPKPFYIGKGIGDRIYQHEKEAEFKEAALNDLRDELKRNNDIKDEKQIEMLIEEKRNEINDKCRTINELVKKGLIEKYIVKWGLTQDEAFMAESALMNAYNKTLGKDGLKNIINGHMSNREKMNKSHKTCAWSIDDFSECCTVEKRDITEINERCIFIKLSSSTYSQYCDNPEDLYEISRGFWSATRKNIEYAVILFEGQVEAAFKIDNEKTRTRKDFALQFSSEEAMKSEFKKTISTRKTELRYMWLCKKFDFDFDKVKKGLSEDEFTEFSKLLRPDEHKNNFDHAKKGKKTLCGFEGYSKNVEKAAEDNVELKSYLDEYECIDKEEFEHWCNKRIFTGELIELKELDLYRKIIVNPNTNRIFTNQGILYNFNENGEIKKADDYGNR